MSLSPSLFVPYICLALKKIVALFLLTAILLQTFMNLGIGVYYHLNKAAIIRQLCENRNNPKLHCNGHCYLSKQLKKAEEKENRSTQAVKEKEEIISNQVSLAVLKYLPQFRITKIYSGNSILYVSDNSTTLLKPPAV
jgi:hypothetical protein